MPCFRPGLHRPTYWRSDHMLMMLARLKIKLTLSLLIQYNTSSTSALARQKNDGTKMLQENRAQRGPIAEL